MINLACVERVIKKVHHLGLTVSLFFLLLHAGGCCLLSRSIVVANLDDTIESFACRAAEGANRAGAKITKAELTVNAGTAFDMEAGTIIPVALPVTAKATTHIEEGTKLTIELDLNDVQCKGTEITKGIGVIKGAPPKIRIYRMNAETHEIQKSK